MFPLKFPVKALQTQPVRRYPGPVVVNRSVFFSIAVDSEPLSHISLELFADKVPKTEENSHALCSGEKGFGYKCSCSHRIIPRFIAGW